MSLWTSSHIYIECTYHIEYLVFQFLLVALDRFLQVVHRLLHVFSTLFRVPFLNSKLLEHNKTMKSHQFFLQICQVRVQFVVQIDLKYFAHSVFDKTKFSKRRHLFSLNLFVFSDEDVFEAVNFVFPDLQFEFEKLNSDFSASKPHFLPSAVQTLSQSRFPALSCPPVYNMG